MQVLLNEKQKNKKKQIWTGVWTDEAEIFFKYRELELAYGESRERPYIYDALVSDRYSADVLDSIHKNPK
jgi:hypothetical protein